MMRPAHHIIAHHGGNQRSKFGVPYRQVLGGDLILAMHYQFGAAFPSSMTRMVGHFRAVVRVLCVCAWVLYRFDRGKTLCHSSLSRLPLNVLTRLEVVGRSFFCSVALMHVSMSYENCFR